MKQKRWRSGLMAMVMSLMFVGLTGAAHGSVQYTASDRGPNGDGRDIWQYDYFVTSSQPFTDFYVTFAYSNYDSLSLTDLISSANLPANPDWAISLTPTNSVSYQDGVYNAVIASGSQGAGQTISGFSVQFVSAAPTDQTYSIYNNSGESTLVEAGATVATPEPTTWALMVISLGTLLIARRRMA